jgi:hypothetical protein
MQNLNFLFDELQTCGAVLSAFELAQTINANIISRYQNEELEKYFKIKRTCLEKRPKGINITFTPKLKGDYAYVRTQDGRWLNHDEPIIAVSDFIKGWLERNDKEVATVIGNGTHERFKNLNLERDIDCLIEGNFEPNKNIKETIKEAKQYGKVVWFGRHTTNLGVEHISNPSLDEIVTLYNRSKKFLKMSKVEGWNRPVAEATACGCEVINKSGGNQDIEIVSWEKIGEQLLKFLDTNIN